MSWRTLSPEITCISYSHRSQGQSTDKQQLLPNCYHCWWSHNHTGHHGTGYNCSGAAFRWHSPLNQEKLSSRDTPLLILLQRLQCPSTISSRGASGTGIRSPPASRRSLRGNSQELLCSHSPHADIPRDGRPESGRHATPGICHAWDMPRLGYAVKGMKRTAVAKSRPRLPITPAILGHLRAVWQTWSTGGTRQCCCRQPLCASSDSSEQER